MRDWGKRGRVGGTSGGLTRTTTSSIPDFRTCESNMGLELLLKRPMEETLNMDRVVDRPDLRSCKTYEFDPAELVDPSLPAVHEGRFVQFAQGSGSAHLAKCAQELDDESNEERKALENSMKALSAAWNRAADGFVVITLRGAQRRRQEIIHEFLIGGLLPDLQHKLYWYIADRPKKRDGTYGCFQSHVAANVFAHRTKAWTRWVIFEDDLMFLPTLSAGVIHNAVDTMERDSSVPLVGMGTMTLFCVGGDHAHTLNTERVGSAIGSSAYLTKPTFAKTIEQYVDTVNDPEERDHSLPPLNFDEYIYSNKDLPNVHHVYPNPAGQRPNGSDIGYHPLTNAAIEVGTKLKLIALASTMSRYSARIMIYIIIAFFILALVVIILVISTRKRERACKIQLQTCETHGMAQGARRFKGFASSSEDHGMRTRSQTRSRTKSR